MSFKKSRLKNLSILGIFSGILCIILFYFIIPILIITPNKTHRNIRPSDLGLNGFELSLTTEDEIQLNGWWINSENKNEKNCIIILIHGIGGTKAALYNQSKILASHGIQSIVMDNRAHGKSGGEYCTFGYLEKKDVNSIVEYILSKEKNLCIGIWGKSLGAAIGIQSMEMIDQIEFGIFESTFTNLNQIVFEYGDRIFSGLMYKPFSDFLLNRAGKIGSFYPKEVNPLNSIKNISKPILIIHGQDDDKISLKHGQNLYNSCPSIKKEFLIIEKGLHNDLQKKGGDVYKKRTLEFISKQI